MWLVKVETRSLSLSRVNPEGNFCHKHSSGGPNGDSVA